MSVKKISNTQYEVNVIESGEVYTNKFNEILNKYKNINIPGFRKGKAPISVIKKEVKGNVLGELLDSLLDKGIQEVKENEKIIAMGKAQILNVKDTEDSLEVTFNVNVIADPELGDYKAIKIEKDSVEVTEEEIEDLLNEKIRGASVLEEASEDKEAELHDTVNIDFTGYVDGEKFDGGESKGYDLTLGTHSFIDTFEDQIVGHKKGEEFDVNVTFPENYGSDSLAGKPALFKVKVNAIKKLVAPEKNDELAKELGYTSWENIKNEIKEEITKIKENSVKDKHITELVDKVVELSNVEIAEEFILDEVNNSIERMEMQMKQYGLSLDQYLGMTGQNKDDLINAEKNKAEIEIKRDIVLNKLADIENITVDPSEIDEIVQNEINNRRIDMEKMDPNVFARIKFSIERNLKMKKAIDKLVEISENN